MNKVQSSKLVIINTPGKYIIASIIDKYPKNLCVAFQVDTFFKVQGTLRPIFLFIGNLGAKFPKIRNKININVAYIYLKLFKFASL